MQLETKVYKNAIEIFVLTNYSWAWGLSLSVVDTPSETTLEKTKFSSADTLLVRGGSPCLLPPLSTGIPSGLNLCRSCACCHSLCQF